MVSLLLLVPDRADRSRQLQAVGCLPGGAQLRADVPRVRLNQSLDDSLILSRVKVGGIVVGYLSLPLSKVGLS